MAAYYWKTSPTTAGVAFVYSNHVVYFYKCGVALTTPTIEKYLRKELQLPDDHIITCPEDCEELMASILRAKVEGKFLHSW